MDQAPTTRTALVVQGRGTVEVVQGLPLPRLSDSEVLVKTASVALNPADAKMIDAGLPLGGVSGLDFAGTVVATRGRPRVGARVCGVVCGYNRERPDAGAFADYIIAEADFVLELPEGLAFEEASTLPIGVLTAGLALYRTLNLPQQHQREPGPYALVYGASTATGTLITQLLQRSGLQPIAICSPHNFDLARRSGATHCFDYHAPACADEIRTLTADSLEIAIDCIASPTATDSTRLCYAALGSAGGRYVALDRFSPAAHGRRKVRPAWVFAMSAFGVDVDWVAPYTSPASPATRAFAVAWFREAEALLGSGALRCHPHRVVGPGLDAVPQGLAVLSDKGGGVSGVKLVCTLSAPGTSTRPSDSAGGWQ